jgi:glycerophosphoryl diester phosphodiesterase
MTVWRQAYEVIRARFPLLAVFALCFRLIQAFALAPLLALAGRALTGRPVVDSTALVQFLLSPRGLLDLLLTGSVLLTLYLLEQAGLTAIALGQLHGAYVTVTDAMRFLVGRAPALLRLAIGILGRLALYLAPFLAVTGFVAFRLLSTHDINFYLARRPPEAMRAIVIIALVGVVTALVILRKLVEWRLSLHVTAFEGTGPSTALARSNAMVHRDWLHLTGYWAGVLGLGLMIASLAAWLASHAGLTLLSLLGDHPVLGAVVVVLMLGTATVIQAAAGATIAIIDASVFAAAYDRLRLGDAPQLDAEMQRIAAPPDLADRGRARSLQALGAVLALALLVAGTVAVVRVAGSLVEEEPVVITGHRGSSLHAPENSLSAIRQAIADSADFAEIDVQETSDGAVVVVHDADLARLAGVARKVRDMTFDEVRAIDIGTPVGPAFAGERVPTLDEVLETAKGKVGVNIELKYYPGEMKLAERVVESVKRHGMERDIVVQSLTYHGLEQVRALDPDLIVGYIMSLEVKDPWKLDVDFYSMGSRLITPAFVARAHRKGREVYAWTVDDSATAVRLVGLGTDNLITNDPKLIRRVLGHDDEGLDATVRRLRAWLGG